MRKALIAAAIYPPDPGGPALHAKKYFEELPKLGIDVSLTALAHLRTWPKGVRHIIFLIKLLIKGIRVKVIYAQDAVGVGLPSLIASQILGKKLLLRIGGDVPWEREAEGGKTHLSMMEWYKSGKHKDNLFFKISHHVLTHADKVIVTSPLLKNLYVEYYGLVDEKVVVVANPIPANLEPKFPMSKTIIYASRLVAYKNLDFVIRSLVEIFNGHPELNFIIMGDGPERSHLENLVKKLKLSSQIIFTGILPKDAVSENTSGAMLGIAPALTEFNPNYILECISFGKPFLISRENGLPFTVPGEFVYDARDPKDFKNKLNWLLDKYQEAQKKLREINFVKSWEEVIRENQRIIESL